MIAPRDRECTLSEHVFRDAHTIVTISGAAELIEDHYLLARGDGGRKAVGIRYTATAVLVALLARVMLKRPPTLCGVMDTIGEFTQAQLDTVGMAGQDCTRIWQQRHREYHRFVAWWSRRLLPFDGWADVPARRMTNGDYRAYLRNRTLEQQQQAADAERRLHVVINRLVAASVDESAPANSRGDLVVDGTLFKVAKGDSTIGTADGKMRGAVACANLVVRDKKHRLHAGSGAPRQSVFMGMTVELTALTRIGKPSALHAVAPVFVGIAIHFGSSGSVEGLAAAWEQAEANGLIVRSRTPRSHWPQLICDMGYNAKSGFAELVLEHRYSPVARFPQRWGVQYSSIKPAGAPQSHPDPGPLQWAGAFYCPAVLSRIKGHRTPTMDDLLEGDGFRAHDKRLQKILPYLMGYNSRPYFALTGHGRPALGTPRDRAVKIKLVCPAAMGTIKCPLKPESMSAGRIGIPVAEPVWQAHELACCAKSSVTVTLTPAQLKRAQWDLVPGSWEHSVYYEAARALTEQRFSQLKSPHVTGITELNYGPRRAPMVKLILAMAVAAANRASQRSYDPDQRRTESIDVKMRRLTQDLGHAPAQTPPRT